MARGEKYVNDLNQALKFFKTTLSGFDEGDSSFAPQPEMFSVAAQVEHVAGTVDWFIAGAFGKGWDMEFDKHVAEAKAVTSLKDATTHLEKAFANAAKVVGGASDADLLAPIPNDTIMGGAPRAAIIPGIADHTAHHRGALSVYCRLIGKEPPMPYA